MTQKDAILTRSGLGSLDLHGPPLPHTLVTALGLSDSPYLIDVESVTRMVEHDPVVTARLLKIVNSAYYGLQRTVDSAQRAVVLLGPTTVMGIVVGMSMMQLRSAMPRSAGNSFPRLVRHSLATAAFARHLGDLLGDGPEQSGATFTAGLLHDFGKMVLVHNDPDRAAALYDRPDLLQAASPGEEREQEQLVFGYDHTEAGEYVARKMDFPDALVAVIRLHHAPMSGWPPANAHLLSLVVGADLTARSTGLAFDRPLSTEDCLSHPVWTRLSIPGDVAPTALARELAGKADDVRGYVMQFTRQPRPGRPAGRRTASSGRASTETLPAD